ncbi:MAG: GAF domain-containing protein, partial [Reyranellales bacterium]
MADGPGVEGGRTIEVLRRQLAAAVAERDEAQARQAALAEVLQAINTSKGDPRGVFDLIIARATSLCDAPSGGLVSVDGDYALALAFRDTPKALTDYWSTPQYIDPNTGMGQVLRRGRTIHHPDMAASEPYQNRAPMTVAGVELGGIRSFIMVPLVNERGVIGIFVIYRYEVRPFSNRQITLVEAFAAQAMLAMENARLFAEQREALEQQTATTEVLEVINASPGDLAPVFDAMLEKAMHLCEAAFGIFGRFDGKLFEPAVDRGVPAELIEATRQIQSPPAKSGLGRIAAGESVVQLVDLANTDIYRSGFVGATALVDIAGAKTAIFVALRKDGVLLGVIVMYRREIRAFSDKQVALLQNFAAQAVIAMENARLITEQRETLEQQTATADILRVIAQSPTDVAPVLSVVVRAAQRFCGAEDVVISLREGDELAIAAHESPISAPPPRRKLDRSSTQGRAVVDASTIHLPDVAQLDPAEWSSVIALSQQIGAKATVAAPLLREGEAVGAIMLRKRVAGPFTERQIQLLETFAAQAVIAIENVRLFTELRESLEQQTATTEILQAINNSPGDVQPVFDAIVDKAMSLCDAAFGMFNTFDGQRFLTVSTRGVPEAYAQHRLSSPPDYGSETAPGRLIAGEDCVHIADMVDSDVYRSGEPNRRAIVDLGGARTILNVALRMEGTLLGMIAIYRQEVRPFSDKEIALLQSFAAQAVIAMENARLL